MGEEKRKFERFTVKEEAYAAFIKPYELVDMGRIQNIGMGGLCMNYLSPEKIAEGANTIQIFGGNGRFIHLDKIRCRVIYDYEVPEGPREPTNAKCCGVEFENLSGKHRTVLKDFIDSFAVKSNGPEDLKRDALVRA